MSGNSWAPPRAPALAALLLLCLAGAGAQTRWFASDAAGIAYRESSAPAASRLDWSLSVRAFRDESSRSCEELALFSKGVLVRRCVNVLAPGGAVLSAETAFPDGSLRSERYDSRRRLVEEKELKADGSGWTTRSEWAEDRLVRSVRFEIGPDGAAAAEPSWTDEYRYKRDGSLLSVNRSPSGESFVQYSSGGLPRTLESRSADGSSRRTSFDDLVRPASVARSDASGKADLKVETLSYAPGKGAASSLSTETAGEGKAETERDAKGRVVRWTRTDKDGGVVEEVRTVWIGDRVASRTTLRDWTALKIEYGYDGKGNRMWEKEYRNGALERYSRRDGDRETEELYKSGVLVLRSVYESGLLASEYRPKAGGR